MSKFEDDSKFLDWVAERLVRVYGESPNADFVQRLGTLASELLILKAKLVLADSEANTLRNRLNDITSGK